MTTAQIKSKIRNLNLRDRIELFRWLDHEMAVDCSSSDFCSRIGANRALEIRHAINPTNKIEVPPASPKAGTGAGASAHLRKNLPLPAKAD